MKLLQIESRQEQCLACDIDRRANLILIRATGRREQERARLTTITRNVSQHLVDVCLAATLIVADIARSTAFYRDVPGAFDASGPSVNRT